jgi:hypothetical protein
MFQSTPGETSRVEAQGARARSGRRAGLAAHGPCDRRVNVWGNAFSES